MKSPSLLSLSRVQSDKGKVEILQNFVAFSEYMNYTTLHMTILIFFIFFYHVFLKQNVEKRGRRDVPGPLKKVPGLLDFFGPGTTGPRDLQGL